MEIAASRNFLFDARCGAKDFFDKLKGKAICLALFRIRL